MPPIRTSWTRLIRFVASETSLVHIGEPLDANLDIGLAFHDNKIIKAREILGSALDSNAYVTDKILTVKQLLSPLSREQIKVVRCLGLNYADHAKEANLPKPAAPILFYKPSLSLIGPEAKIIVPAAIQPVSKHLPDYEVELTVVIGKPCKDVSEVNALDYVLGYMTGNDMSFRYHQMLVSQWGFSKGFDDSTPIGPCLVSSKVISNPQNLSLKTFVNGTLMQDGTTADQIFNVRQTIAFLSQGTTLEPGSIIMTGTPKGVGFVRKPVVYLKHGDEVKVSIGSGLGTLINYVKEEEGRGKASSKL